MPLQMPPLRCQTPSQGCCPSAAGTPGMLHSAPAAQWRQGTAAAPWHATPCRLGLQRAATGRSRAGEPTSCIRTERQRQTGGDWRRRRALLAPATCLPGAARDILWTLRTNPARPGAAARATGARPPAPAAQPCQGRAAKPSATLAESCDRDPRARERQLRPSVEVRRLAPSWRCRGDALPAPVCKQCIAPQPERRAHILSNPIFSHEYSRITPARQAVPGGALKSGEGHQRHRLPAPQSAGQQQQKSLHSRRNSGKQIKWWGGGEGGCSGGGGGRPWPQRARCRAGRPGGRPAAPAPSSSQPVLVDAPLSRSLQKSGASSRQAQAWLMRCSRRRGVAGEAGQGRGRRGAVSRPASGTPLPGLPRHTSQCWPNPTHHPPKPDPQTHRTAPTRSRMPLLPSTHPSPHPSLTQGPPKPPHTRPPTHPPRE